MGIWKIGLVFTATVIVMVICQCDPSKDNQSLEMQLKNKLLCNYDNERRPVKNYSSTVNVRVLLFPKYITTEEEVANGDTITVHAWLYLIWKDEYLQWKHSDYENIDDLRIFSDRLWIPELVLFNSGSSALSSYREYPSECVVSHDGLVVYPMHVSHIATCETHIRHWPFDWQNCSLVYRTWIYQGEHINLTSPGPVDLFLYKPNPHWKLESFNMNRHSGGNSHSNITYPSLAFWFLMRRHSVTHAATIVTPAAVMLITTLISITMKVDSFERIYFLVINIFCHFTYISQMLSVYIPSNGTETVFILLFFRDSTVINVIILILTVILKDLLHKTKSIPSMIDLVIELSHTTPGRWIMHANSDQNDLTAILGEDVSEVAAQVDKRNNEEWKYFVSFVNRCLFFATLITYCGLFIALI